MSQEVQERENGYRAFISYSHRDDVAAKSLHKRLETYRLPKKLIGQSGERGPIPERLTPIFRDLDELSAADDLTVEIKAALARSATLIVLCSPGARASKWVNLEIETFRALHGNSRPVLAALIKGEPADAFPPALVADGQEPVAADFRKNRDGKRLALLKLVAGMAGAPLDALVQRDAQRQYRRVMAITGGALTAALAMALLLVVALRAQSEAERQRQEAEGLVEYMLTDLRDKLKGVGRLDVMTAVNERAMKYYGGQEALESLPAESLERRARILQAMGEDDVARGDKSAATAKFAEAHRYTGALLASDTSNPEYLFAHGQSEYWIGYVDFRLGDAKAARPAFLRYKAVSDTLNKHYPNNQDYLKESAYADGSLCSVSVTKPSQKKDSLLFCKLALDKLLSTGAASSNDINELLNLADYHAWLADAYMVNEIIKLARYHRIKQLDIIKKLLKNDARNAQLIELIATSNFALAKIEIISGNPEISREYVNFTEQYNNFLLKIDKDNVFRKNFISRINQLKLALDGKRNDEIIR